MNFGEFKQSLSGCCSKNIRFRFESGGDIEVHCHVTEIGKVTKDFVDCGGTRRKTEACVFQTYVANDVDHRVTASTLGKIIAASEPLGLAEDLPVEVEYQTNAGNIGTIGTFAVTSAEATDSEIVFVLASKATACLAPELCKIELPGETSDTAASDTASLDVVPNSATTLPQSSGGC